MGAEIEQLPDLAGYLKIASRPEWRARAARAAPAAVRERTAAAPRPRCTASPARAGCARPGGTRA